VKVNYGIRPDGSKDFPELPADGTKSVQEHFKFWEDKDVPDSWKNSDLLLCIGWRKGSMALGTIWRRWFPTNLELHEFYNKIANKDAFFAEVYNPAEYRIIFD
jgi:hypothetical protein